MKHICNKLFVYGTLQSLFANPESIRIKEENTFMGTAFIKGSLYEIAGYPGAIYDPGAGNKITGELYQIREIKKTFRRLDRYEEASLVYNPDSEYQRILVAAIYLGQMVEAWMYQYSKPVTGLLWIPSGNYLTHLHK